MPNYSDPFEEEMSAMPTTTPDRTFNEAKHQFMEHYGSALVTNTYLKIALAGITVVCLGLVVLNFKTVQKYQNVKPLVIRISDLGQAEALNYSSFEYQPQEAELKYFLTQFVIQHYSRVRATVRENYARSLYFLEGRLADATIQENKKNKTIEKFLANHGTEIEVEIRNVQLEDLRASPYKATVDFDKVYYTPSDHLETKRESYVAHLIFVTKEHVSNQMIPINPLGFTILYLREDQAFSTQH